MLGTSPGGIWGGGGVWGHTRHERINSFRHLRIIGNLSTLMGGKQVVFFFSIFEKVLQQLCIYMEAKKQKSTTFISNYAFLWKQNSYYLAIMHFYGSKTAQHLFIRKPGLEIFQIFFVVAEIRCFKRKTNLRNFWTFDRRTQ